METKFPDPIRAPADRVANVPAAPATMRGVYREVVIVALILALLIPAIWLSFSGPSEAKADPERDKQVLRSLALAKAQLDRDFLTWPPGENARETYSRILHDNPDNLNARKGLESVGQRLLSLLKRHTQHQDLYVAHGNLYAAETLLPDLKGTPFEQELNAARQELARVQQQIGTRRQALVSAQTLPAPLGRFRDKLADGTPGPELILLPGGTYIQGSALDEIERDNDEAPLLRVTIRPFSLGYTEITFAEYDRFAQATGTPLPNDNGWGRGNLPVINISWLDAKRYAVWLSDQTGFRYRLPTESEWEYAARAGTTDPFHAGPCLASDQANVDATIAYGDCPVSEKAVGKTLPVGSFAPNPWGLHDIHGNVREFIEDCWLPSYQGKPPNEFPSYAAEAGSCGPEGNRVARGGAWDSPVKSARSANRFGVAETEFGPSGGIRIARDLE